jgi:hypothetical protein
VAPSSGYRHDTRIRSGTVATRQSFATPSARRRIVLRSLPRLVQGSTPVTGTRSCSGWLPPRLAIDWAVWAVAMEPVAWRCVPPSALLGVTVLHTGGVAEVLLVEGTSSPRPLGWESALRVVGRGRLHPAACGAQFKYGVAVVLGDPKDGDNKL